MLKFIMDKHIIFAAIGGAAVIGAVSKCIVNLTLKRLVHASGNMGKSSHPFMRLVRAKFEHACMVSDKVENVNVFVDKYLYEYKVAGLRLHSIRRMEIAAAFICILLGGVGAALEYSINGMSDMVLRLGAGGAGAGIFVYLFHLTTDENYRLAMVKNYMVDYLQNVCLHRYEKTHQKELQVMAPEVSPIVTVDAEQTEQTVQAVVPEEGMLESESARENVPEEKPLIQTVSIEGSQARKPVPEEKTPVQEVEPEKEAPVLKAAPEVEKEIRIRQILEEFMA